MLLLQEAQRIRRAGGIPFTEVGGLASRPAGVAGGSSSTASVGGQQGEEVAGLRESDIGEAPIPALSESLEDQDQPIKEEQVGIKRKKLFRAHVQAEVD